METSFLLVLVCVCVGQARLSRVVGGDDTGLGLERIHVAGGFDVVYARDHDHIPDVALLVHDLTELGRRQGSLLDVVIESSERRL